MISINKRHPFEGVLNIVRFNWHFYLLAVCVLLLALFIGILNVLPGIFNFPLIAGAGFALFYLILSLVVSYYIYDVSELYRFSWLKKLPIPAEGNFINIHSGFDETSEVLKNYYPKANWQILDFYNPEIHTEVSIARARKYRPVLKETISIDYQDWKIPASTIDIIFGILAIHEIREHDQKILFFKEACQSLKSNGNFVLVEHLRNLSNFLAYGPGFLHFFPASDWRKSFQQADLQLIEEFSVTPFVRVFVLKKKLE